MFSSRFPLAVVSKTLPHSTLSTTVNLCGHLLSYAARDAEAATELPSRRHHVSQERIQRACHSRQTRW
ncbi:hypothetical protein ABT063_14205 [Streptomyces sp. NPDC002838]|uniref:hypothetical protein n=1 Tax=Streptomyces sp. NPDC002838 TaxID=3154436 RepID=UPI003324CF1E